MLVTILVTLGSYSYWWHHWDTYLYTEIGKMAYREFKENYTSSTVDAVEVTAHLALEAWFQWGFWLSKCYSIITHTVVFIVNSGTKTAHLKAPSKRHVYFLLLHLSFTLVLVLDQSLNRTCTDHFTEVVVKCICYRTINFLHDVHVMWWR